MQIVFLAGPYIGPTYSAIDRNIQEAEAWAIELANRGIGFFCPHTHTRHFEEKAAASETFYKELDKQMLIGASVLLLMPRWRESKGAIAERELAESLEMPIFEARSIEDVDKFHAWLLTK